MLGSLKRLAMRLPQVRRLIVENDTLKKELAEFRTRWKPGHFYSPIPDMREVVRRQRGSAGELGGEMLGVELNEYLLRAFLQYNRTFTVNFFTSMMLTRHPELMARHLPVAMRSESADPTLKDTPGSSLWIERAS